MGNNPIAQTNQKTKSLTIKQMQNHQQNKNDPNENNNSPSNKDKQIKTNLSTNISMSNQNLQSIQLIQIANKLNKMQTLSERKVKIRMNSQKKQCSLICPSITIQNHSTIDKKLATKLQIEVPFDVIIITCSKQLRESMTILGDQLIQRFIDKSSRSFTPWKLHQRGFYINYITKKVTSILTFDKFYEGELIQSEGKFLPSGKGTIINENGKYTGQFFKGKAHGNGKWYDRIKKTVFSGHWENGQLEKGKINNSNYDFTGLFVNNIANGLGVITFKQSKTFYKGGFRDGLYDTTGFGKGYYQSQKHIYQGDFIEGKKHNYGVFMEKGHISKKKLQKYCSHLRLEGLWQKDILIQHRQLRQTYQNNSSKTQQKSLKKQQELFIEKINSKIQNTKKNRQRSFSALNERQKHLIVDFANLQDNQQE